MLSVVKYTQVSGSHRPVQTEVFYVSKIMSRKRRFFYSVHDIVMIVYYLVRILQVQTISSAGRFRNVFCKRYPLMQGVYKTGLVHVEGVVDLLLSLRARLVQCYWREMLNMAKMPKHFQSVRVEVFKSSSGCSAPPIPLFR